MIREFRLSSTMGDTVTPQRPDLSPMAFLYSSTQYEAASKRVQGYDHFSNTSYLGLRTTWLQK